MPVDMKRGDRGHVDLGYVLVALVLLLLLVVLLRPGRLV